MWFILIEPNSEVLSEIDRDTEAAHQHVLQNPKLIVLAHFFAIFLSIFEEIKLNIFVP